MKKKASDNRPCKGCPLVRNTINGHYCTRLHILTEYTTSKPCNP